MKTFTLTTPEGSVTSINVIIDGKEVCMSTETARKLHSELSELFGQKYPPNLVPIFPNQPSMPWTTPLYTVSPNSVPVVPNHGLPEFTC